MRVKVVGKTDSIITLNLMGIILQGKVQGVFDIYKDTQKAELNALKNAGLIDVICLDELKDEPKEEVKEEPKEEVKEEPKEEVKDEPKEEVKEEPKEEVKEEPKEEVKDEPKEEVKEEPKEEVKEKKRRGRPRGPNSKLNKKDDRPKKKVGRPRGPNSKLNKKKNDSNDDTTPKPKTEEERVGYAEAETQKMGSSVVISIGNDIKKVSMRTTFAGEIPDSEATRESIEAMDKLVEEEKAELEGRIVNTNPTPVDDSELDPSEQTGRFAVISDMGEMKKVEMVNSIVPGSEESKNRDPFIDNDQKTSVSEKNNEVKTIKKVSSDALIDIPSVNNDPDDLDFLGEDPDDMEYGDGFIEI